MVQFVSSKTCPAGSVREPQWNSAFPSRRQRGSGAGSRAGRRGRRREAGGGAGDERQAGQGRGTGSGAAGQGSGAGGSSSSQDTASTASTAGQRAGARCRRDPGWGGRMVEGHGDKDAAGHSGDAEGDDRAKQKQN